MNRRNQFITWLLIVVMPLAGCQTINVSYRETDTLTRSLSLAAVEELNRKHPKYVTGITFEVYKDIDDLVTQFTSYEQTPVVIENLEPGLYTVNISGKSFKPHTEIISLVEEPMAILQFAVNPAKAGKVVNDGMGLVLGAALVTVGFVVYLLLESVDDDDDDC